MNRRDMLFTTGSMIASATLGSIACGANPAVAQSNPNAPAHHHGGDGALSDAAHACMTKGEACIAHCIAMLTSGDTSMAGCMKTVHDMQAVMEGLAAAAASGSRHLPALAKVAMEFCKDCEAECRKHADKHVVCKECADACARTIAACQKAAG
ncbi:MAG: four-helix bundle copper-binding protein [Deltaproteobacteria bacterium]|nr:four-helix bundle copper-binding protein [Deltaproteobacteria bacterium]